MNNGKTKAADKAADKMNFDGTNYSTIKNALQEFINKSVWVIAGPEKQPINALTGRFAKTDNPATWSTYPQALDGMKRFNLPYIGFVFTGCGIGGVDIDNCIDKVTGRISDIASDIISTMGCTYIEKSLSGTGLHILYYGKLLKSERQCYVYHDGVKGHLGIYDTGRFFIVTGNVLDDGHTDIEDCTDGLLKVWEKYLKKPVYQSQTQSISQAPPLDLDDQEIIRRASRAKNGDLFRRLWEGNWQGLKPSQSEADIALVNCLIFWCGKDPTRVSRLFMQSGLMRDKFNRRGAADIEWAISTFRGSTYRGGGRYAG